MADGRSTNRVVALCAASDIGEGEARGFGPLEGWSRKIIVVRRNGRLFGWLDSCPHYAGGTPMAWKTDAYLNGDRTHLACHSHGAQFEIETGLCTLGPCLGQHLTSVPLIISGEGEVTVDAELWEDKTPWRQTA